MRKIKFNPVLYVFYVHLWAWISEGCPGHHTFSKHRALCSQLTNWLHKYFSSYEDSDLIRDAYDTQCKLFQADYGEQGFPFNAESGSHYDERQHGSCYRNLHRTAFIQTYSDRDNWLYHIGAKDVSSSCDD